MVNNFERECKLENDKQPTKRKIEIRQSYMMQRIGGHERLFWGLLENEGDNRQWKKKFEKCE